MAALVWWSQVGGLWRVDRALEEGGESGEVGGDWEGWGRVEARADWLEMAA
jgi:hypothetical protein